MLNVTSKLYIRVQTSKESAMPLTKPPRKIDLVVLPNRTTLARRLAKVEVSRQCIEAHGYILSRAGTTKNTDETANILFIAATRYIQACVDIHQMNTIAAYAAAKAMILLWAQVLVQDDTTRQAILKNVDSMMANAIPS